MNTTGSFPFLETIETKMTFSNETFIGVQLKGAIGTNIHTRLTEDTPAVIENDNSIFILNDGTLHRTGFHAKGIFTLDAPLL
jgi:hypothetical protein